MQAIRQIVDREQLPNLSIPFSYGQKVEIIILPLAEQEADLQQESQTLMNLQEQTGFAKEVLAADTEDVWNDV